MNRKKKIAISTALLLLMQLLVGLATQNPANASVISGDSHEWGLPLVPGVGSTYYTPQALQSDTFISQMSIGGGGSALALQNDGTAISWGNDDQGQLGDGSSGYHTASAPMLLPPVVQVSSGGNSWGVGLTGSGEVYSWGRNSENELGRAGGSAPDKVPGLPFIKQIAAGNMHAIALDSSGNVWAWG